MKTLLITLALASTFALAACGKKKAATTPSPASESAEPSEEGDKPDEMREDDAQDPGDDSAVNASDDPSMGE